jgi:uncharacterized membrane protein (DUF373 family)
VRSIPHQYRIIGPLLLYLERFERIVTWALLLLMAGVVLLATIELAWVLIKDVLMPPVLLLDVHELLELFGMFLLVLIGIELLHTVKAFIIEREVHLETMFTVAMIAVARKMIVLEPKESPVGTMLGIAALVFALAIGYYVMRRSRLENSNSIPESK